MVRRRVRPYLTKYDKNTVSKWCGLDMEDKLTFVYCAHQRQHKYDSIEDDDRNPRWNGYRGTEPNETTITPKQRRDSCRQKIIK